MLSVGEGVARAARGQEQLGQVEAQGVAIRIGANSRLKRSQCVGIDGHARDDRGYALRHESPDHGRNAAPRRRGISAVAHGPTLRRDPCEGADHRDETVELPVATAAAVLAEVVRGQRRDAGVFSGLRRERVEVHPVDVRVGVRAGQLLGAARSGSERAIDAFIVAIGDLAGGAVNDVIAADIR